MSKSTQVTLSLASQGDGIAVGSQVAWSYTNAAAPSGGPQALPLVSGNNTITPPTGARGFGWKPATGTTTTLIFKGVAGDTGITVDLENGGFLPFKSSPGSFVINASANITIDAYWI